MASVSSEPSERSLPGTMGEPKKPGFTIYISCQRQENTLGALPEVLTPSSNNTPIIRISSAAAVGIEEVTGRRQKGVAPD